MASSMRWHCWAVTQRGGRTRIQTNAETRSSEQRARQSADDHALLPEPAFELLSEAAPPHAIQVVGHHLENDDVVARRSTHLIFPDAPCGRACVRRHTAESIGELRPQLHVVDRFEVVSLVVVHRNEKLN